MKNVDTNYWLDFSKMFSKILNFNNKILINFKVWLSVESLYLYVATRYSNSHSRHTHTIRAFTFHSFTEALAIFKNNLTHTHTQIDMIQSCEKKNTLQHI